MPCQLLNMGPEELRIRAKNQTEKEKVLDEIRDGRWEKINYPQVCRDLDAQMNYELRLAREQGLA